MHATVCDKMGWSWPHDGPAGVQMMAKDDRVTALHLTGSTATYNAITWGHPEGPAKSSGRLVTKPFSAELGCVTPYIVVPSKAKWTDAELHYQAMSAVVGMLNNSGHNCNATEVIVTARNWPQRDAFLQAVRTLLNSCQQRWLWYPGAAVRFAQSLFHVWTGWLCVLRM